MTPLRLIKRIYWALLSPIYPSARDALLFLGLLWHERGRQRYHLGWLRAGRKVAELEVHLAGKGFLENRIAWIDEGEVLGLRRLTPDHFHQYHLRIFADGEIRGHYEVAPEHRYLDHFLERGMEARRDDFLGFLGDWVVRERQAAVPISLGARVSLSLGKSLVAMKLAPATTKNPGIRDPRERRPRYAASRGGDSGASQ